MAPRFWVAVTWSLKSFLVRPPPVLGWWGQPRKVGVGKELSQQSVPLLLRRQQGEWKVPNEPQSLLLEAPQAGPQPQSASQMPRDNPRCTVTPESQVQ